MARSRTSNPLPPRIGGSFAPPVDKDCLDRYEQLAGKASPQVAEAMKVLIKMCRLFIETPRSSLRGSPHPSGAPIAIVPLEEAEKERIFDAVPWAEEIEMYTQLFDKLPTGSREGPYKEFQSPAGKTYFKPDKVVTDESAEQLRNACFHLLWYARELDLDREPLTSDQLQG